jgi:hypothetical protein
MSLCTLMSTRLQVELNNYVNVEAPRNLYNKLDTIFSSCFLTARWQMQQQQPNKLCCAEL